MKIVALIKDGHGRLHLRATCAPDLVRRQYSAETGCAELLWCGVPPTGTGAGAIVEDLRARFGERTDGSLEVESDKAVHALIEATIVHPMRRKRMRQFKRFLKPLMQPFRIRANTFNVPAARFMKT